MSGPPLEEGPSLSPLFSSFQRDHILARLAESLGILATGRKGSLYEYAKENFKTFNFS